MNVIRHTPPRLRRAFTLVEVLMATAILTLFSTGLLYTTLRLSRIAHSKAEEMMADGLCHDIMWAVYNQDYDDIKSISKFSINKSNLPRLVPKSPISKASLTTVYPLRRGSTSPNCTVTVANESRTENGHSVTNKKITVKVTWYDANKKSTSRSLTVRRSAIGRGKEPEPEEETP